MKRNEMLSVYIEHINHVCIYMLNNNERTSSFVVDDDIVVVVVVAYTQL